MKTIIISIGQFATLGVLKIINTQEIQHQYLGLDQNDQMLMQLSYSEPQAAHIHEIKELINEMDKLLKDIKFFLILAAAAIAEETKARKIAEYTKKLANTDPSKN